MVMNWINYYLHWYDLASLAKSLLICKAEINFVDILSLLPANSTTSHLGH